MKKKLALILMILVFAVASAGVPAFAKKNKDKAHHGAHPERPHGKGKKKGKKEKTAKKEAEKKKEAPEAEAKPVENQEVPQEAAPAAEAPTQQ